MTNLITVEEVQREIREIIESKQAHLVVLRSIQINESHKKLTNRAIVAPAEGVQLRRSTYNPDFLELHYSWKVGHSYNYDYIRAYKLGDSSQILTPPELAESIKAIVSQLELQLREVTEELARVGEIVAKSNELREQIDAFNQSFIYGGKAKIYSAY